MRKKYRSGAWIEICGHSRSPNKHGIRDGFSAWIAIKESQSEPIPLVDEGEVTIFATQEEAEKAAKEALDALLEQNITSEE